MTGNNPPKIVHFLLLGHSRDHIVTVTEEFNPDGIVLFTSADLALEHAEFIQELELKGVNVYELVTLSPFSKGALESMTEEILTTYERYVTKGNTVVMGLTGGTNLMVTSMALAALQKGCLTHYCVNDESKTVLSFNTLKRLSSSLNHQEFERILVRGDCNQ